MEDLEDENYFPNKYNVYHFLRNVCSPCLAELLTRELKNSKFIKEALMKDLHGTFNKTLYEILRNVHSKGRRNADKNKGDTSGGAAKTQTLMNLKDNMAVLSDIPISVLLENAEVVKPVRVISLLSKLDVAFLLNVLTNSVLDLPLLGLEEALNILKSTRNGVAHKDCYSVKLMWEAVESIHRYLGKDIDSFEKKRQTYLNESLITCCSEFKELRHEFHNSQFRERFNGNNDNCVYCMQPTIRHMREDGSYTTVEDLAKFVKDHRVSVNEEPRPILLCGAPGSGKSQILHTFTQVLTSQNNSLLLVHVDCIVRQETKREIFWKDIYDHLLRLSPHTVQKHGQEKVLEILYNYSRNCIFLWDMNLYDSRNCPPFLDRGTWVLSYQGVPETSTSCHVIKVASLSQKQVSAVLWQIQVSDEHYRQVYECYKMCEYKLLINTPEMVHIFDKVCLDLGYNVPFYRLIHKYITSKVSITAENESEFIKLGEKAFNMIIHSKKYYREKDLADVCTSIYRPFMVFTHRGGHFQYRVVEDYLAAIYIVKNRERACVKWLRQATLFKRVFTIVLTLLCDEGGGRIGSNKHLIRKYLEKIFEIVNPECKEEKRRSRRDKGDNEPMDVDGDMTEGVDARWSNRSGEGKYDASGRRTTKGKGMNDDGSDGRMDRQVNDGGRRDKDRHGRVRNAGKKERKQQSEESMEVDDDERRKNRGSDDGRSKNRQRREGKTRKKDEEAMEVEDEGNDDKNKRRDRQEKQGKRNDKGSKRRNKEDNREDDDQDQTIFVRWVFLSKIAKEHEHNTEILELLADLLTYKQMWRFKSKLLTETYIEHISVILQHVKLKKPLHIKIESGPNVVILNKLWRMLASHENICANTTVAIQIHDAENGKLFMHESQLAGLLSIIAKTQAPLYVTKFVGPLICSTTPQFLKCLCMRRLEILDVCVYDLASLCQVLEHGQHSLISVIVKLNLKLEQQNIPGSLKVQLSPTLPLTLTINYFENLQSLLDAFDPPAFLHSLRIYQLYIHEHFKLDLNRFEGMESLFIRLVHVGKPPAIYQEGAQEKVITEMDDKVKSSMLSLDKWTFKLVMNLHLPTRLERFFLRNLTFCDDLTGHLLYKYWESWQFQRLILLETNLSLSKFLSFFDKGAEDLRERMEKKCCIDADSESQSSVVRRERLPSEERGKRRNNKPEGKELIMTSEFGLCAECQLFSCACRFPNINTSLETYRDLVKLAREAYSSKILNLNYSGQGVVLRKDMCDDLMVQCSLPFLDDLVVHRPKDKPELELILEALVLAHSIRLTHTNLSHQGALILINELKERKRNKVKGTVEPFHLTILSCYYHCSPISEVEVKYGIFMSSVREDAALQQFNFNCDGCTKCYNSTEKSHIKICHKFKKSTKGMIFFNDVRL